VKLGVPIEAMLCGAVPVLIHCHRTLLPTATVSTAAFTELLRSLRKKLFPTVTITVPGSGGGGGGALFPGSAGVEPPQPARTTINSAYIRIMACMTNLAFVVQSPTDA